METLAPSFYSHFNARFSSIDSLVNVFIASENFTKVAHPAHTVVLGPRGSGKTCLLKMLQPAALSKWKSATAEQMKANITYVGVYIPTDISWSKQAEQLGKPGLVDQYQIRLQESAFTAQVLVRLLDTVIDCIELKISAPWADVLLDFSLETQLASQLAEHWKLELKTATLSGLKQKLAGRVIDIWRFGRKETLESDLNRNERFIENNDLNFDFVEEVSYAITLINDITKKKDRQWALLFDELEIAPPWLVDKLFPLLRSTTNQNVFFKLSMSPFGKLSQVNSGSSPRAQNDYEVVHLWYTQKIEATPFSRELLVQTLRRRSGQDVDLYKIFGHSPLKPRTNDKHSGYGKGSRAYEVLTDAVKQDPGFRAYVEKKQINLDELDQLEEDVRAADIRKVYPIVLFRREFLKFRINSTTESSPRSRKKPQIFSGIDSFLEILEGNPRWIVGAANELAETVAKKHRVTSSQQYTYLRETAERFMSLLKTIPLYEDAREQRSLGNTLDEVGDKIHQSIVQERFTSEPFGSFKVDKECPEDVLDSLGIAMNAGAIILLSAAESNWLVATELRGKEFRMSYLFSPYKHIPFRIGRAFPLSEILRSEGNQKTERINPSARPSTGELDFGV